MEFAGPQTLCSLEGDLSRYTLTNAVAHDEAGSLRRHTLWPKRDFAVIRLDLEAANQLLVQLEADPNRAVNVEHIQVERHGQLVMGGYDGLDATWVGASFPREDLDRLAGTGSIKLEDID